MTRMATRQTCCSLPCPLTPARLLGQAARSTTAAQKAWSLTLAQLALLQTLAPEALRAQQAVASQQISRFATHGMLFRKMKCVRM